MEFNANASSCCKLNLDLEIGDYDEMKGLHRLTSRMTLTDFAEKLEFTVRFPENHGPGHVKFGITPDEQQCPSGFGNTMFRALGNWHTVKRLPVEMEVRHDDAVPAGKGLGIASSNAAMAIAVLETAAREMLGMKEETRETLGKIAITTGSDVPFFLFGGGCATVTECGDGVKPERPAPRNFIIAIPETNANTGELFKMLYENGTRKYRSFSELEVYRNFRRRLYDMTGENGWRLTGSGSAFFLETQGKDGETFRDADGVKFVRAASVQGAPKDFMRFRILEG